MERRHAIATIAMLGAGAGASLASVPACSHQRELDAIQRSMEGASGAEGVQSAGRAGRANDAGTPFLSNAAGGISGGPGGTTGAGAGTGASAGAAAGAAAVVLDHGFPVLSVVLEDFKHYDEHDRSLEPTLESVIDQPFALARRFPFGSGDGHPGSAGYFAPSRRAIAKADVLRAFFWARCHVPQLGTDRCQSAVVFEEGQEPYRNGGLEQPFRVAQEWTLFTKSFVSLRAYDAGLVQLTFRLGYPDQVLEIGAAGVENYGTILPLAALEALDRGPFAEVLTERSFAHYGTAVSESLLGLIHPFGTATRFSTSGQTFDAPEDSGLQGRNSLPIFANDLLLAAFWARCFQSERANGECRTALVFEESNSPYVNAGLETPAFSVSRDWMQFFFPFRAVKDYEIETVKLGFRLGFANQVIEFGPITVRRYGMEVPLTSMPETRIAQ